MTLIQTVWTKDIILQVSDRRLTIGRPKSKSFLIDDEAYTKLIHWNNTFTAGFTGLARIDRWQKEPTSEWIAGILSDSPTFEYGLEALKVEAPKRIKKLPKIWDRRLAIVIAGFDHRQVPLVGMVTNFDQKTYTSADEEQFQLFTGSILPGHKTATHTAGARINNELHRRLRDHYVPKILGQHNSINRTAKMMVKIQRLVADEDPTVGKDALCVFIPRKQPDLPHAPNLVMGNLGGPDIPTGSTSFGFFDHRGWRFEDYGPLIAQGGFVKKVWASADPDNPDNQTVGMRMLKVPASWK